MPRRSRSSSGTEAWVIVAGCEMSVSTPPRLSPSEQRRTGAEEALRRRRASRGRTRSSPPKPRIWRFASAWLRVRRGGPGSRPSRPSGASRGTRATSRPFSSCRGMRTRAASWCRAARASESNGERIAPARSARSCSHSACSRPSTTATPPTLSRVAVQELRRRVDDDVGAERERPLEERAREGVVDDDDGAAPCAISASGARCRRSSSVGLVGVSSQSMRVAAVTRLRTASGSVVSTKANVDAVARQDLREEAVGAAVRLSEHDDVLAGLDERHDGRGGGHARGEGVRVRRRPRAPRGSPRARARVGFCVRAYS